MKKTITVAVAVFYMVAATITAGANLDISAKSAILMEPVTGTVLYEKNADDKMLIASITKIMTALVALENRDLNEEVTVSEKAAGIEGSSLYLEAGDKLPLVELLYGMMLRSGNDAAAAVACSAPGGEENFVKLMNEKAASIGCTNTHFDNPHGLDSETHYSSARDMALITAAAVENEDFLKIVSTKNITIGGRTLKNHNKLLWDYDGTLGVKTGYTKAAGRTLVSCARRGDLTLICVTLSAPDDWNDHTALYDDAFSRWEMYSTPSDVAEKVSVISGETADVQVFPENTGKILIPKGARVTVKTELPAFVYAEVSAGDRAGIMRVSLDGEELFNTDLKYKNDVKKDETQVFSFWKKLQKGLFKE